MVNGGEPFDFLGLNAREKAKGESGDSGDPDGEAAL